MLIIINVKCISATTVITGAQSTGREDPNADLQVGRQVQ